jgi:hypothetical protein
MLACSDGGQDTAVPPESLGPEPVAAPASPVLRRLTQAQYTNAIVALFGDGIFVPTSLEPDVEQSGLVALGAGTSAISPRGVEQYESAAFDVAEQVLADRATVTCDPVDTVDDDCAAEFLAPVARIAWRRPLSDEELESLVGLSALAAAALGDFHDGLVYGLAAVLQSPWFLYRVELGVDGRLTDLELATRLAFFLWDDLPDETLLAAAEAGELATQDQVADQVDRMLADPRARAGLRNLFTEMLQLSKLDDLNKDTTVFPHMSPEVGASAREQTLLGIEDLVFEMDADFRTFLTTRRTYLDRTLAAIYNVRAPEREGFGVTEFSADGPRRGYLGQVSFLAPQAHPVSSSATKRGVFVREILLCQPMSAPPADVDTSIPEPDQDSPTLRERIAVHLEEPGCASCHELTDYIGLGLEQFDGLGLYRTTENGAEIDPSGVLDGQAFDDAWGLGAAVRDHSAFAPCLVETLWRYGGGQMVLGGEREAMNWLVQAFELSGYSYQTLLRTYATSQAFRTVGAIE